MIKCFRLSTGEDIIGKIVDGPLTDSMYIEFPVVLAMGHIPGQGLNLHMAPLVATNPEATVCINANSHLVYSYEPAPEVETKYKEITSKLILPSSGLIQG